tara:strand:+ start:357 stop:1541 length:1185 start_codon:yes stop_codon:yes gene_type:complete
MLYDLFAPLDPDLYPIRIFQYISFRAAGAAITALLISFLIGPRIIRTLSSLQIGETINNIGPDSHHAKKGTPTMGGIIIILSIVLPTILWAKLDSMHIQIMLISTIWMGLIGFLDDYLKVVKRKPKGLIARYKMAGLVLLGVFICLFLNQTPQEYHIAEKNTIIEENNISSIENTSKYNNQTIPITSTSIPFIADGYYDIGMFYYLLIIIVICGSSNAVNLTDGLDGLASGLVAICMLVFGAIAYIASREDWSYYLNIIFINGAGELSIFCITAVGACIGFLWYNSHPASVFMGDTGSLSLGAALGTLSILLKKEILLVIIGGVFVVETISVIIQVLYFKYTKKKTGEGIKFFKMAPLHHHYELSGWHENKVVVRFWIAGILLALISLATFKIQ